MGSHDEGVLTPLMPFGSGPDLYARFVATTDSDHDGPIFPNLAKDLVPSGPNQLWVCGITYGAPRLGWSGVHMTGMP